MTRRSPRFSATKPPSYYSDSFPVIREALLKMKKATTGVRKVSPKTGAAAHSPLKKVGGVDSETVTIVPPQTFWTTPVRPPKAAAMDVVSTDTPSAAPPGSPDSPDELACINDKVCLDCGTEYSKANFTRRVIDACGHAKCRTCFIVSDYQGGCKQCLPTSESPTLEDVTQNVEAITIDDLPPPKAPVPPTPITEPSPPTPTDTPQETIFVKPSPPPATRPKLAASRRLDTSPKNTAPIANKSSKAPVSPPPPPPEELPPSPPLPSRVPSIIIPPKSDPLTMDSSPPEDILGANLIPAARVALTLSSASDKVCLECGTEFNTTNHRRIFEECGHLVCWQCFLAWEDGCQQCAA